MVSLADYLTAKGGTSHNGWDLRSAAYASPDGKRIAGTGFNPQMVAESWIVTLPCDPIGERQAKARRPRAGSASTASLEDAATQMVRLRIDGVASKPHNPCVPKGATLLPSSGQIEAVFDPDALFSKGWYQGLRKKKGKYTPAQCGSIIAISVVRNETINFQIVYLDDSFTAGWL